MGKPTAEMRQGGSSLLYRIKNAALSVEGVESVISLSATAAKDGLQVELTLKINGGLYEIKGMSYNV